MIPHLPSAGRLTWLVYIIGAVIGGRGSTYTTFDEYDALDGELVCRYYSAFKVLNPFFKCFLNSDYYD